MIFSYAAQHKVSMREAATMLAVERIAQALKARHRI